jgi:hypothetical protein
MTEKSWGLLLTVVALLCVALAVTVRPFRQTTRSPSGEFNVSNPNTFRVRFRFRLQKKLSIAAREHRFNISGREVVLSPQLPDSDIADSDWLVMSAKGFESEHSAAEFAQKLKAASEISSVAARLGIDTGVNRPTSGFGKIVKDRVRETAGLLLRDNIHGIDVFPDDPAVRIGHVNAVVTVRSPPDPFLADLDELFKLIDNASQRTKDIVLLLNYALMRPEPVAQIVFAISAVEMLGQDEDWSSEQRRLLDELAVVAEQSTIGSDHDRREVAAAILRGTQKLGLRQGVIRLLSSLGLEHLKQKWDELYAERSTLVHGLAPKPDANYGELAHRAVSLCGQVLLTAVAQQMVGANKHVDKFYEMK